MRLKQIKLAGFKSFVEPTKIPFPDQMTAIVGPNGCGKSNVIDAVRWVLGESSAKNLRGDAMTDVIFNGSSGRKAISVASVELLFDNQQGRLSGSYANFAEVSVKRQVTRDGQSDYFLNGNKCRRRDITDLFMGTGLGPRSYAIIEQGMISRLIESKPQELRVFLEEAAGISKYKERRRETENRIRHTRENLERLNDVRHELGGQIDRLRKQADSALKFRELKAQEHKFNGELIVLRWRELSSRMEVLQQQIQIKEGVLADLDQTYAGENSHFLLLEQQRTELNGSIEQTQHQLFQISSSITKLEQQILHSRQSGQKLNAELLRSQDQVDNATAHLLQLEQDKNDIEQLQHVIEPELYVLNDTLDELMITLEQAQLDCQQLTLERDDAKEQVGKYASLVQVSAVELLSLERELEQLAQEVDRIEAQLNQWDEQAIDRQLASGQALLKQNQTTHQQLELLVQESKQQLQQSEQKREIARAYRAELAEKQIHLSAQQQALALLMERHPDQIASAFEQLPRAWQCWQVEPKWERAVEQVLSRTRLAVIGAEQQQLPDGMMRFTAEHRAEVGSCQYPWVRLIDKINTDLNLAPWLSQVYCADDETQAHQLLAQSSADVSVVLPDGRWFAQGFEAAPANLLCLAQLQQEWQQCEQHLLELEAQQAQAIEQEHHAILALEQAQEHSQQLLVQWQHCREQLLVLEEQTHQLKARLQEQHQQQTQLLEQRQEYRNKQAQIALRLAEQEEQKQRWQNTEEQLQQQLDNLTIRLDLEQQKLKTYQLQRETKQQQYQQFSAKLQNNETRLQGVSERYQQGLTARLEWLNRIKQTQSEQAALIEPLARYELELELQLEQRVECENRQIQQRELLETLNQKLTGFIAGQRDHQGQRQLVLDELTQYQLEYEGQRVQAQNQQTRLVEANLQLKELLQNLPAEAEPIEWQKQLERIRERVKRLGAINLAAIDEYEQEAQRKAYLDAQDADLTQALAVLEAAIRKIDRETKQMFKDTFDKVNTDLGVLFPKVFGGGSAELTLTDEDLLNAGVSIMARPPGKKNSTIHLLSGGEKALTALSLVFAIFRLNPAPFCLLDEVDAPLDDANVERFCRLVKEMSQTVQFIFISHNKVSMEMAERLTGVTMHEPGVSRIVAVDIEQAAEMAQMS